MKEIESYKIPSDEIVTLESDGTKWAVACWKSNGDNHWYIYKPDEASAREEYERWRY